MSTRANVIIKDESDKLYFYRHSDGCPEGTMPSLNIFLNWIKEGKIGNNISQSAGWLIILGAIEYNTIPKYKIEKTKYSSYGDIESIRKGESDGMSWKVGAYEPTTCIHGDIEYLYTIDLIKKEIEVKERVYNDDYTKSEFKLIDSCKPV